MCNITKHCYLTLLCVLYIFYFSAAVEAGVYQCRGPSGVMEYRDRPCDTHLETQQFLPIQYHSTHAAHLKKQAKELQSLNKQLSRQEQKINTLNKRTTQAIEKEKAKKEKLKHKCAQLSEKINHIESQLRSGCKIQKVKRLTEQLAVCQAMQDKICVNE